MFHHCFDPRAPADELAQIRAQIARLRRREAELREAYLTRPDMPCLGRWTKVEIVTSRRKVFEPRLLPPEIRNDTAFQREKVTRRLQTSPHEPASCLLPELVAEAPADAGLRLVSSR
ncbi:MULTISPECIES: hypothetical protein [Thioclava]|uniref:hypothetical protein n=1 Tax=Thioclava TaxID=285107 RepID=UPI000B53E682|nr:MULTISPECIES: hypothetical protein [Thioclava]OWY09990.1 hypothetical protein B6V74_08260 [Thioclava sp. F42-5]WGT49368.1 hypothetical protein P0N61_13720 [Thioclava nitratireducens]